MGLAYPPFEAGHTFWNRAQFYFKANEPNRPQHPYVSLYCQKPTCEEPPQCHFCFLLRLLDSYQTKISYGTLGWFNFCNVIDGEPIFLYLNTFTLGVVVFRIYGVQIQHLAPRTCGIQIQYRARGKAYPWCTDNVPCPKVKRRARMVKPYDLCNCQVSALIRSNEMSLLIRLP